MGKPQLGLGTPYGCVIAFGLFTDWMEAETRKVLLALDAGGRIPNQQKQYPIQWKEDGGNYWSSGTGSRGAIYGSTARDIKSRAPEPAQRFWSGKARDGGAARPVGSQFMMAHRTQWGAPEHRPQ